MQCFTMDVMRPHWREPYEGEFYVQAFLHYVYSRGSTCQLLL